MMERGHLEDALFPPLSLNQETWMSTDSASRMNTPATKNSRNSCLMRMATRPSVPPSERAPTSPMKTWAGWQLNQRKPRQAPARAPTKMVSSAAEGT